MRVPGYDWIWPVLLIISMLVAYNYPTTLAYQRDLLLTEPWRLFSAHIAHLNLVHLLLNLVGLVLVWLLVGEQLRALAWILCLLWVMLTVSLGLYLQAPHLLWYLGLSGVLHGLLATGAVVGLRRQPLVCSLLLLVLALKLAGEQWQGADPLSSRLLGTAVLVDAHLYGALAGVVAGLGLIGARR